MEDGKREREWNEETIKHESKNERRESWKEKKKIVLEREKETKKRVFEGEREREWEVEYQSDDYA